MAWRKWLVRSLVLTIAGVAGVVALAYQQWTNPEAVRYQVVSRLEEHLTGAVVNLESARFRLFGGISLSELRLARRDDPTKSDFAYIPSGIIYPDKEQLLNGKLPIRKIEWNRPRLRVIRRADGTWNMANILGPVDPRVRIPTIVIRQGIISFEDLRGAPGRRPIEVKDVNLTIINNPQLTLVFQGTGVTDLAGTVQVTGSLGRVSKEFVISFQVPSFPVGVALVDRLAAYYPEAARHANSVTGTGKLRADLSYHPDSARPWTHDIYCQLTGATVRHPQLPLPLNELEASVHLVDGQITLEKLSGRSGAARVQLSGKAQSLSADTDLAGTLRADHLHTSSELFAALPIRLQAIQKEYEPDGSFGLALDFQRKGGRWREHCTVRLEEISGVCDKFPYRLDHVGGTIEHELDPSRSLDRMKIDLVGFSNARPVYIQGRIEGPRPAAMDLAIKADNVPLDDKLVSALKPEFRKIVHGFNPSGFADIEAYIRRKQGETEFAGQYIAHFHDVSMRYDVFPYPVENVTGTLDIQPDGWEYRDFRGTHNGGEFQSHGAGVRAVGGKRILIAITGRNVLLNEELEGALRHDMLKRTWRMLNPGGRMSFEARVDQIVGAKEPDIEVVVSPRGSSVRPAFFPYALSDLDGTVHYHNRQVELNKVKGRHGQSVVSVESGKVYFKPDGGFSVDLIDLMGNPIVPENDLHQALPAAVAKVYESLRPEQPVSLRTNLTIDMPADHESPPNVFWDGGLRLTDATLHPGIDLNHVTGLVFCRGNYHGEFRTLLGNLKLDEVTLCKQPLRDVQTQIVVSEKEPDFLELPSLKARLFGGDVGGSVRIGFGQAFQYEVNLTASQIQLEEFGRHQRLGPKAQLSGAASARLFLKGQGNQRDGLEGAGSIDVPNGKMGNLPLLIDLLKVLNLRWPDRTAFEEARIRFAIHGRRVEVRRLDLFGNAVSLSGHGMMDLDGSNVNLDFYAVWARVVEWLPPIVDQIPGKLSQYLLKVKMRGSVDGKVQFTKEVVPVLVEPLEEFLKRLRGRRG
jgi:hypothetical protein